MKRVLIAFLAGFLATLVFHQPVLWLLHNAGIAPFAPWSMTPVKPFGVPSVISLAFWGGVWGIIMIPVIARIRSEAAYFLTAAIFGAILPTLVAALVSAPLHGKPIPKATPGLLITGLSVNAAWGLGTAIFFRLFARRK
jgi:hypothetical protein